MIKNREGPFGFEFLSLDSIAFYIIMAKKLSYDLADIFENYFGIDLDTSSAHYEVISRDKDAERFQVIRDLYLKHLASHPLKSEVAKKLFVGEDVIIHLHHTFLRSEVADIKSESVFYYPICTINEIKRIEEPRTAADYLLKLRADPIAKNPRIARIFLSRMSQFVGDWSLGAYYSDYDFFDYVEKLPNLIAEKCRAVPAGFALLLEPNGACIKIKFGRVIIVSEALRHFLYYMNVFAHHRNFDLDFEDAVAALFIAIKTMLQTEAPDFDIDPRGDLPDPIHNYCRFVANDQLQFVIGHEYAHLILGHLEGCASMAPVNEILTALSMPKTSSYYTPRQQQEFDADLGSIMHAEISQGERARMLNGAILFFLYLDIFYSVSDYINPSFNRIKTHPDPIERIWTLRKAVFSAMEFSAGEIFSDQDTLDWIGYFKKVKEQILAKILPYHIEDLESYGSIYFPGSKKTMKIDRFDF